MSKVCVCFREWKEKTIIELVVRHGAPQEFANSKLTSWEESKLVLSKGDDRRIRVNDIHRRDEMWEYLLITPKNGTFFSMI